MPVLLELLIYASLAVFAVVAVVAVGLWCWLVLLHGTGSGESGRGR